MTVRAAAQTFDDAAAAYFAARKDWQRAIRHQSSIASELIIAAAIVKRAADEMHRLRDAALSAP